MASIQRHSSGRSPYWFAKFRGADGTPVVKSTKQRDRKLAFEIALNYEKVARKAEAGLLTESHARKVIAELYEVGSGEPLQLTTAEEFFGAWLKTVNDRNAGGTKLSYESSVKTFLKSLGKRAQLDLRHLSAKDILRFRSELVETGVANQTINLKVKTISVALNVAKRQQFIIHNPVDGVESLPSDGETRVCFTLEQIRQLLAAANDEWRGMILIGYFVGPRISVCAKMTRSAFNLKTGWVTYTPNKRRRGSPPKSITCPIHPSLSKYLRSLGPADQDAPIFPSLCAVSTSGKTGLSESFVDLALKAGIEIPRGREKVGSGRQFKRLGFHSLRHSFNSNLANAGVSKEVRKLLIGHASDDVNETYTHIQNDVLKDAISKLSSL